ncbi:Gfo/Idh/MocA family oxidoreductase [Candidatus Bathyarchaeota archaeon]|nr:Gfo/Idh/MocA family oxidoreductase [Candidatus Bathyarchaeota archaeon]MBS7627996.1 Gfo/Idh/MocA family oxidoreductase [Candidatus Bathyarchaeota archaeon]
MVRIGFIGCGGISHTHVQRLSLLGDGEAEIVGLCDTNLENAKRLASLANKFRNITPKALGEASLFMDHRKLLDEASPEAVIVCTPHVYHYEHAMAALEKGIHVLVEKPMAISLKEAETMKEEAERRKLVLSVGYQRHFQPEYIFARNIIKDGRIGRPHFALAWLTQDLRRAIGPRSWYLDPKLSGGGQLVCSGTHLTDLVLWVLDAEPLRVKAIMEREGSESDMYSSLSVELSNGALASISVLGDSPEVAVREELRVWCSHGAIFVIGGRAYLQEKGGNLCEVLPQNLPRTSPNPDVNFVRAILGKEECLSSAIHGLRATKLERMAYEDAAPLLNRLGDL